MALYTARNRCSAKSSGTLGGLVFETGTRKVYGLTNGHVCGMSLKVALAKLPMILDSELGLSLAVNQTSDRDHESEVSSGFRV